MLFLGIVLFVCLAIWAFIYFGSPGSVDPPIAIGNKFQGGVIFYIDASGQHGLIAAPSDQGTATPWGCYETEIPGADGTAIGAGFQNTSDIIAGCAKQGIAARLCANLVLDGYSDWFLPSKDELNKLFLSKLKVGGFSNNIYWSSTEASKYVAWYQNFNFGFQNDNHKEGTHYVRAVRAF